jgi:hypothetical protein
MGSERCLLRRAEPSHLELLLVRFPLSSPSTLFDDPLTLFFLQVWRPDLVWRTSRELNFISQSPPFLVTRPDVVPFCADQEHDRSDLAWFLLDA